MLILFLAIFCVFFAISFLTGMWKVRDMKAYGIGIRILMSAMFSLVVSVMIWLWILGILHILMG